MKRWALVVAGLYLVMLASLTVPATLLANLPTGNGRVSLSRVNIQKGAAANAVVSVVAEAVILGSVVIHP